MASLSFNQFLPLPRCDSKCRFHTSLSYVQLWDFRLHRTLKLAAKKKIAESLVEEASGEDEVAVKRKTSRASKRATTRTRKKDSGDTPEDGAELGVTNDADDKEAIKSSLLGEASKTTRRRTTQKATTTTPSSMDEKTEKKMRRDRRTKQKDNESNQRRASELSDAEMSSFIANSEEGSEEELDLGKDDEDISYTYGWPPLVCCFGSVQHAFVPSGRPSNRLVDYEIHERKKNAIWAPEKFIRAPGGSAGSVAIALASLGGKVAFMGKLGDDDYGQCLLYYMNVNKVQTRAVCIDSKRATAASQMKVAKRGRLRASCVKPCAEDSLSKSDINIDVLKEAKMFYFSTHSLLDRGMRSSTLRALKISKKLGGMIFYDVNLPLPLWHSGEEAKNFIQEVWKLADIIEVTKQELEFLCGIKPIEEFDTKNNARTKFVHYEPEVVEPLWHENLKILFVTNGTSKIHYYTKDYNGAVRGMEDPPLTPFTCDMSASGDGIVAGLMRMLTVQPHLINDKGYLEHSIRYASNCGVIDQWQLARERGYPPREDIEEEVEPDLNGIRSVTEREYRTLTPVS